MIDEEELDGILDTAKRIVIAQGDTNPTLLIQQNDGLIVVNIPFEREDKDKVIKIISKLVTDANSTRYYFVFTGWMVQYDEMQQRAEEELLDIVENGTKILSVKEKERVAKLLLAHSGKLSPSENPFRHENLMVCRFDKQLGSDVISIELKREGTTVDFGEKHHSSGSMYICFNIWSQHQIDLNKNQEDNDEEEDDEENDEEENGGR